jgi:hypothetical protein
MNDGGITVSKTTTGSFYIEDIQVLVPHKEPVYIPGHKAVSSVDLHRALGTKELIQLMSTLPLHAKPQPDQGKLEVLENENRLLREALAKSTSSTQALERQVANLVGAVEKLASAPPPVVQVVGQGAASVAPVSEAVGGETPMFIPEEIVPKAGVDIQVRVQEEVSEGASVSEAANRLRQLRKGRQD